MVIERLIGLGEQRLGLVEQVGRGLVGRRRRDVLRRCRRCRQASRRRHHRCWPSKPGNSFASAPLSELPNAALLFCDTSTNSMVGCDSRESLTVGCT